jgi:rubrerythrin
MSAIDLEKILLDALDDERKAEATYAAVIERFGQVRPFSNIISAEQRHSRAIERQLARLGFEIPDNIWEGKGKAPTSLAAACELAVQAEIDNIALYDRLIPQIEDAAVQQVFQNLQDASRENHLPAFRRCLAREQGQGAGGRGRGGRGHGRGCRP